MTVEERTKEAYETRPRGCGNASYEDMIEWLKGLLNDQIEDCAKVADRYEQEERAESKKFAMQRAANPQAGVAQATHAIMSVICGRIGKDIRALGGKQS